MKILNLYACLGGNRFKWGEEHTITAVELDPDLAELYQKRFPNDMVIVTDAHKYLINHFEEFDFIWTSPPCPSHSRARFWNSIGKGSFTPIYPDLTLYQEIILLQHFFKGKYVVENVIPYYPPLIPAKKRQRHLFWTNFELPNKLTDRHFNICQGKDELTRLMEFHEIYNIHEYKGKQRKDKLLRNMVDYKIGESILNAACNTFNYKYEQMTPLF